MWHGWDNSNCVQHYIAEAASEVELSTSLTIMKRGKKGYLINVILRFTAVVAKSGVRPYYGRTESSLRLTHTYFSKVSLNSILQSRPR
jgi:hypothetical protein